MRQYCSPGSQFCNARKGRIRLAIAVASQTAPERAIALATEQSAVPIHAMNRTFGQRA
jgi:hypothetical protein